MEGPLTEGQINDLIVFEIRFVVVNTALESLNYLGHSLPMPLILNC